MASVCGLDVLASAMDAGARVVLNLGGAPPPAWLEETLGGRRVAIAQTNAGGRVEDRCSSIARSASTA
jgi:hypothetical protein